MQTWSTRSLYLLCRQPRAHRGCERLPVHPRPTGLQQGQARLPGRAQRDSSSLDPILGTSPELLGMPRRFSHATRIDSFGKFDT